MTTTGVGQTILVVDDDVDIRRTLALILEEEGYRVTTASNGREALDSLGNADVPRPSLILLDMMMPIMDGSAFRAEQRKAPAFADIPVIVFSAHGNARQTADVVGAAGYLAKPLRLDALITAVARSLAGQRL